jgi:hypothetical protein
MPFDESKRHGHCTVCNSRANLLHASFNVAEIVDCERCGDFHITHVTADDLGLPYREPKQQALASYTIRKMFASSGKRVVLTREFFEALKTRSLPTPMEVADNLIVWMAEQAGESPGRDIKIVASDASLMGTIGLLIASDIHWLVTNLVDQKLCTKFNVHNQARLTISGWQRFEELKRAHVSSNFAFFARKFDNSELDQVFKNCLYQAVKDTGYELRTATQRAGLVDAIIEDEIRRCRFLIADLSDSNAGAYWEAGFAEGLGKPVIYICKAAAEMHFDTDHRHTVRWDLSALDQTAKKLKAVIRNTLLGDAKQAD